MSQFSDTATQVVVALGVFILTGYVIGSLLNRYIGQRWARYCWRVLSAWSARGSSIRWYGINGFQIDLPQPPAPFRSARMTVILQPRNLLWLWLLHRLRGYGELLVFRADLQRVPAWDLDIVHSRSRFRRDAQHEAQTAGWQVSPGWRGPLALATDAPEAGALAADLMAQFGVQDQRLRRLTLRRHLR